MIPSPIQARGGTYVQFNGLSSASEGAVSARQRRRWSGQLVLEFRGI
jgi:hypothetical protein